jgi:hypothetical protein
MNLITAKLEINNARLAARITAGTIGGPPVSTSVVLPTLAASTTSRIESITSWGCSWCM